MAALTDSNKEQSTLESKHIAYRTQTPHLTTRMEPGRHNTSLIISQRLYVDTSPLIPGPDDLPWPLIPALADLLGRLIGAVCPLKLNCSG